MLTTRESFNILKNAELRHEITQLSKTLGLATAGHATLQEAMQALDPKKAASTMCFVNWTEADTVGLVSSLVQKGATLPLFVPYSKTEISQSALASIGNVFAFHIGNVASVRTSFLPIFQKLQKLPKFLEARKTTTMTV